MKTIKRKVLVVVFMLGTLLNYANNTELSKVLNAKKVKVVFKGAKKGQHLKIKDNNGVTLYAEAVSEEGKLIKIFDFSKLEDGEYTLELDKDFLIIVKSIKIKENKVVFNEDAKKVIFKPVIKNDENRLKISKIAFDAKPLEVTLYYNDEIIYSETVKGETIINRVYKLDEEIKGDYRVVIHNNGRSYINEFKI